MRNIKIIEEMLSQLDGMLAFFQAVQLAELETALTKMKNTVKSMQSCMAAWVPEDPEPEPQEWLKPRKAASSESEE